MWRLFGLVFPLLDVAGSNAGGGGTSGGSAAPAAGSSASATQGSGSSSGSGSSGSGSPTAGSSGTGSTGSTGQGQGQRTGSGTGATTGSGQGQQGQGQQQLDDIALGNWRELRGRYDDTRTRLQAAEANLATWNGIRSNAASLAKSLGFEEADFNEAFQANPFETVALLNRYKERADQQGGQQGQGQGQNANGQPMTREEIAELVRRQTAPMTQHVNQQMTEAAMTRYESNLGTAIQNDPVLKDAPESVTSLVKDYLGEYFATQPAILEAMKMKGDYSAVPDALKFVSGRLHSAFTDWLNKRNAGPTRTGQGNQQQGQQGQGQRPAGKRPTLDEMINDPGMINSRYAE